MIRGRIDAVYKEGDGALATYEIVDWKTGRQATADPLQLAVYRVAWAEQLGVPLESVGAAFVYVRTGETVRPAACQAAPSWRGSCSAAASARADRRTGHRPRPDRLKGMSETPDSAVQTATETVRTYIEQHRAAFLDDLAEWLRIPSVSAQPDHDADVRRSADWLAAKLRETGFPVAEILDTPGRPGRLRRVALGRAGRARPSWSTATTTCSPRPARTAGTPTRSSR